MPNIYILIFLLLSLTIKVNGCPQFRKLGGGAEKKRLTSANIPKDKILDIEIREGNFALTPDGKVVMVQNLEDYHQVCSFVNEDGSLGDRKDIMGQLRALETKRHHDVEHPQLQLKLDFKKENSKAANYNASKIPPELLQDTSVEEEDLAVTRDGRLVYVVSKEYDGRGADNILTYTVLEDGSMGKYQDDVTYFRPLKGVKHYETREIPGVVKVQRQWTRRPLK